MATAGDNICHKLVFLQMAWRSCAKCTIKAEHRRTPCKRAMVTSRTGFHTCVTDLAFVTNLEGCGVMIHIRHLANEDRSPKPGHEARRPTTRTIVNTPGNLGMSSTITFGLGISRLQRLCMAPAGRTFLKLLRAAINRVLIERDSSELRHSEGVYLP